MTEPAAAPAPSAPRRSRRRWLLVVAVTVAVFTVGLVWLWRDEPAPDVSDLVVKRRTLTDDENAFATLVTIAGRVDAGAWADEADLFLDVARGRSWDAAKAKRWLAANDHVWAAVERAVALRHSEGREMISLDDMFPAGQLRQLGGLLLLRAWAFHHDGKSDEAFASVRICLRVAQHVQAGRTSLIEWLTGIAIHGMARETAEVMVKTTAISAAAAREFIATLEQTRPASADLADALRAERAFYTLAAERMEKASTHEAKNLAVHLFRAARSSFLFKPHLTERLHAEHLRRWIARVDYDWPTLQAHMASSPSLDARPQWNPHNRVGRMLLEMVTPTFQGLMERHLRTQSAISATQTLTALRQYEAAHSALPENLGDLVPAYLPQVPRDYFDGAEIRYSREFRALWSVGKNNLMINAANAEVGQGDIYHRLPPRN